VIEAPGNLWNTPAEDWRVVTTNLSLGFGGYAVMGRGVAREAVTRFSGIRQRLGLHISRHGHRLAVFPDWRLICFPVKTKWHLTANLELIRTSAEGLRDLAFDLPGQRIWMPRPGCGNGHRDWLSEVRPIVEPILPDRVTVLYWRP